MSRYGPTEIFERVVTYEPEYVPETPELVALRKKVEDHDELFERCSYGYIPDERAKKLDELYAELLELELKEWIGAKRADFDTIRSRTDIDFPIIRFRLGMMPEFF